MKWDWFGGFNSYDRMNRLVLNIFPDFGIVTHVYDLNGNRLRTDGPRADMADITYFEYDHFDRLRKVTDPLHHRVVTEYDLLSNETAVEEQGGIRTEFAYNDIYQRTQLVHAVGEADERTIGLEVDPLGRRTAIINGRGFRTDVEYTALGPWRVSPTRCWRSLHL